MLDSDTKRKIDTCRQILVGKVPDPKAQVDQITTALIYKFMDDMDKGSVEIGGRASYFVGSFKQYSWSCLMDRRLSGQERLDLYVRAMNELSKNPKLPDVFKDVFKNAFLPYRDSETLNLFLKEIDGFRYDHSEDLGDAFEYLLSVLGSQGDAGQFRTPRHIIDFMVEVLDPQKEESMLDPACGTGGFLISSYRHIIKRNSKNYDPSKDAFSFARGEDNAFDIQIQSNGHYKGEKLKPLERKKVQKGTVGYDISPDMVKFSLVNMFLHKFQEPQIHDYDTLTSDDRWGDDFDVILANPPFMSPKGGIRPHSRFSVESNRSEVLFVDYIAEHLTLKGRAGVIVPEGIIFKGDKAYKKLRKMLVDDRFLWAVVSLPSGVFQPYSGVKTSILFLDRQRSKGTDEILFIDVGADGFDLGATRRRIEGNDLPEAFKALCAWRDDCKKVRSDLAHWVSRDKIRKSDNYNLSGSRYREVIERPSKWPMVKLGDVCKIYQPKTISQKEMEVSGKYIVFGANGPIGRYGKYNHEESEVLVTCRGATCGTVNKSKPKSWITGNAMVIKPETKKLNKNYLFYLLKGSDLSCTISGSAQPQITRQSLSPFKIPLPPLDVQKELVSEVEAYQRVLDGARQVVEHWKPTIKIDSQWPLIHLDKVCEINPKKSEIKNKNIEASFVPMSQLNEYNIQFDSKETRVIKEVFNGYTYFKNNDILLAKITPCFENGKSGIAKNLKNEIGFGSTEFIVLRANKKVLPKIIYYFITNPFFIKEGVRNMTGSAGQKRIPLNFIKKYKIPLPSLEEQKKIVSEIEKERELVDSNKKIIDCFKQKINATIDSVWTSTKK